MLLLFYNLNSETVSVNIILPMYVNSSDASVCMEFNSCDICIYKVFHKHPIRLDVFFMKQYIYYLFIYFVIRPRAGDSTIGL